MHLSKAELQELGRIKRLNIINSLTGIKPANLIATKSDSGHTNLAIISSVVHLGSNPAIMGYITRPTDEVRRDTYENILENGIYTINHIPLSKIENAHYTSAKFEKESSEFDACGFTEEYMFDFQVPFVKESPIKMALKRVESIPIKINGTLLVIGEIEHIICPNDCVDEQGYIDLEKTETAGIAGLNSYYELQKITDFPYARVSELPEFKK